MKKVLLASVALVSFAAAAHAEDKVKLAIGGFAYETAGYAGNKANQGKVKFDSQDDVVVSFAGTSKLDNGLSVGVTVETFGTQRADSRATAATGANSGVKRSYVSVSGGFGSLIAGEREDVGYIVHNSAPDVGALGLQDGVWHQWIVNPSDHRLYNVTTASRYDARSNKLTYVTPAFAGLAAGVTYSSNIGRSTAGHTTIVSNNDLSGLVVTPGAAAGTTFGGDLGVAGLAYANKFGDISVKADAGVGQASIVNLRVYQGGTQISAYGFTLGGSIFVRDVQGDVGGNKSLAKAVGYGGASWDAGVSYATGPVSVSVGYFQDRSKDDAGLGGTSSTANALNNTKIAHTGAADSTKVWSLGAAYTVGAGVTWKNSVSYVDYKDGGRSTAAANSNKGTAVVTGVKVDF